MTNRFETFRDCTIPLSPLKILNWYSISCSFYGYSNEKIGCVNYAHFSKSCHVFSCKHQELLLCNEERIILY